MILEFAKLPDNPTKEQIDAEILRLKATKIAYKNKDSALKIILNSVYGVAGFTRFICYDRTVAEAVTLQSQHLLKYSIKMFNDFFLENWNKGDIQPLMGITKFDKCDYEVVNYADTDSVFPVLRKVYASTDFAGDYVDFMLKLKDVALDAYIYDKLEKYVDIFNGFHEKPNGDRSFILEMEQICSTVLWTSKKKYIKVPVYIEGKRFKHLDNIQVKGLTINQSSSPKFVREQLKDIVHFILEMGRENFDLQKLIKKLRDVKTNCKNTDIQNICKIERISKYEQYVISDKKEMVVAKGANPHLKGACYHNFKLYNSEYLSKYQPIKSGSRVCWYYTENSAVDSFSFIPGELPMEIDPPAINFNMQFETMIIAPLNTILKALDVEKLTGNLVVETGLW